jgi:hypothetical protein
MEARRKALVIHFAQGHLKHSIQQKNLANEMETENSEAANFPSSRDKLGNIPLHSAINSEE